MCSVAHANLGDFSKHVESEDHMRNLQIRLYRKEEPKKSRRKPLLSSPPTQLPLAASQPSNSYYPQLLFPSFLYNGSVPDWITPPGGWWSSNVKKSDVEASTSKKMRKTSSNPQRNPPTSPLDDANQNLSAANTINNVWKPRVLVQADGGMVPQQPMNDRNQSVNNIHKETRFMKSMSYRLKRPYCRRLSNSKVESEFRERDRQEKICDAVSSVAEKAKVSAASYECEENSVLSREADSTTEMAAVNLPTEASTSTV